MFSFMFRYTLITWVLPLHVLYMRNIHFFVHVTYFCAMLCHRISIWISSDLLISFKRGPDKRKQPKEIRPSERKKFHQTVGRKTFLQAFIHLSVISTRVSLPNEADRRNEIPRHSIWTRSFKNVRAVLKGCAATLEGCIILAFLATSKSCLCLLNTYWIFVLLSVNVTHSLLKFY
jgi:hypothetical protein